MKIIDSSRSILLASLFFCASTVTPGCGGDDEPVPELGAPCEPDVGCGEGAVCEALTSEEDAETVCLAKKGTECDPLMPYCSGDLVCAATSAGEDRCFEPVVLQGQVSDTSDASAVASARLLSLDEEGVAVTDVAESDEKGDYRLELPVERDEDGKPVAATFTLNASAQDYQSFPSGARVALPISTEDAALIDGSYVIESALTNIGLIPLEAGDRVSASGSVQGLGDESQVGGLLIVATGAAGTFSAMTDKSGAFTLFNLPEGNYELKAYGAGIQVEATSIDVGTESVSDLKLPEVDDGTTKVSGTIQIVNAPGGAVTSVILVVADTFNETASRGEVPRGLRAPASGPVSIDGAFEIEGVPAGEYVVLAAYENDDLVRDPDTNISGTDFVRITVSSDESVLSISDSFKVTEALAIAAPGKEGPEAVTEKPTLEWADDSSEDWYDVYVYDAFGDEVWSSLMVPGVSGSDTVSVDYEGPLDPGMYYQFRVTSWRQPGKGDPAPISSTEDLRGVFFLPSE